MDYPTYMELIKKLNELYGTVVFVEHSFIHEFYEGDIPLFKLILSSSDETQPPILIISYHVELPSPAAIQWFLRIQQIDPNLHITGCYLKDAQGISHVGEDAEILRMYVIEQEVISAWIKSDQEEKEMLEKPNLNPPTPPSPVFVDIDTATTEFNKMSKKKDDTFH